MKDPMDPSLGVPRVVSRVSQRLDMQAVIAFQGGAPPEEEEEDEARTCVVDGAYVLLFSSE